MVKPLQKIFSEIPRSYELTNHIVTAGLDVFWRKKAARYASNSGGGYLLDVCSGTGEFAHYLNKISNRKQKIAAVDFSLPMIKEGRRKLGNTRIDFIGSDARFLPFRDGSFDMITISFATRNLNLNQDFLLQSLHEFKRVLKPGGIFLNLETSQPESSILRGLFHRYVHGFVRPVGSDISGSRAGFSFLAKSIKTFYRADEFSEILEKAGFRDVEYEHLTLGFAAVHKAVKY